MPLTSLEPDSSTRSSHSPPAIAVVAIAVVAMDAAAVKSVAAEDVVEAVVVLSTILAIVLPAGIVG